MLVLLGVLVLIGAAMGLHRFSRRRSSVPRKPVESVGSEERLSHHLHQSECGGLLFGGVHRGLLRARAVSLSSPSFLFELGETRLSIAGIVIAGFAVGGLFYTLSVSRLLPRLGVNGMMVSGAVLVASQLAVIAFGPRWQLQSSISC